MLLQKPKGQNPFSAFFFFAFLATKMISMKLLEKKIYIIIFVIQSVKTWDPSADLRYFRTNFLGKGTFLQEKIIKSVP